MRYIQSLLELWSLLFICLAWGRRILDLGPSWIKRKLGLYLAPGVGLASLLWFASIYGRFQPFHWLPSFTFILILVGFSLFKESRRQELWQQTRWLCLWAIIASLPVLAPEFRYAGYSPFTDIFTYLAQGQWLQFHAFSEKILSTTYHPAFSQISLYQHTGARMGGTFFLGFVQSLFHLTWSYDAYLPTVALGVTTGCLFLGGIVRQVVPLKKPVILALSLLPAVSSNGFIFGAEWGFFPQTYGLAFALGLTAFLPALMQHLIRVDEPRSKYWLFALPTSLCGAAMLLAYNEPFPLFLGGIGLFIVLAMLTQRAQIKNLSLMCLVLLIELMFFMNTELIRLIHNIYQTLVISHGALSIGWPVPWSPARFIAFTFGLSSYFNQKDWLDIAYVVISPILLGALLYLFAKWIQHKPKRRLMISLLICFEVVLWCFFIKFRYFSINDSPTTIGQTFLQFKVAKYTSPFSLSLLAIGCGIIWFYCKSARRYLIILYILLSILGLHYHLKFVTKYFNNYFLNSVKQQHAPFDVFLKLRQTMEPIPKDQIIYLSLSSEHMKLRQFLTYVLWDRPVIGNFNDDNYLPKVDNLQQEIHHATWALFMNDQPNASSPFVLQKQPFLFATLDEKTSDYLTETNKEGQNFNWIKNAIDMKYNVHGNAKALTFSCLFRPIDDTPRNIHIEVKSSDGHVLISQHLSHIQQTFSFNTPWLPTQGKKDFVVHIESDSLLKPISPRDSRQVSFMITNASMRLSSKK